MTDTEEALVKARQAFGVLASRMKTAELQALALGLESNDPALLRGKTALPYPLRGREKCQGACLACYGAWKAGTTKTAGEVNDYFDDIALRYLGPTATSRLTGVWDHDDLTNEMALVWVREELARRTQT